MSAVRTPPAAARLAWRQHDHPGGGYVRTAIGANGSLLVNTFLADRGHPGRGVEFIDRLVIVPAELAAVFLRGLVEDVEGRAN